MRPRKYIFFFYWVIKYYTQNMMKVFLKASINIDKIFRWTFHFPVQYTQNIWASFCCVVGVACTFFITFSRWFFLPWHYCWKSEQDPCRSTLFDEGWKYSIRRGGPIGLNYENLRKTEFYLLQFCPMAATLIDLKSRSRSD